MNKKTYDDLEGKVVRADLSREGLHGGQYGMVRRVVVKGKKPVLTRLTFQLRGADASSLSARCRGTRVVLHGTELDTIAVKLKSGRFVALDDWMAGNTRS